MDEPTSAMEIIEAEKNIKIANRPIQKDDAETEAYIQAAIDEIIGSTGEEEKRSGE
jgi:hypothetical protein